MVYTKYIARDCGGYSQLVLTRDGTLEEARESIDESLKRAESLGYNPSPYLICKVETFYTEERDDNGMFKSSTSTTVTTAIEWYPCRPSGRK